jgi:predicted acylesterase/phospholipase RssA
MAHSGEFPDRPAPPHSSTRLNGGPDVAKVVDISGARAGGKARTRASKRRNEAPEQRPGKTALVLTGGGFTGAVYQIGALRALDLLGVNYTVNDFDMYVGTSCVAFVSALIANGARPEDMMALLDGADLPGYEPLELGKLMKANWKDLSSKAVRLPRDAMAISKDILLNARRLSLTDVLTMFAELLPTGFYSLDGMTDLLERQLGRDGFTDDFRELARELYIVATDIDTCEPVVFGEQGWDDVSIAKATAASAALPFIYRGVGIRGREFVDGGIRSFANVQTAVDNGAKLVVIVNSIVPFDNARLNPDGKRRRRISERGMAAVGTQMFKALVWSAMHERLKQWRVSHPDVDFILIEPRRDDELMFQTQVMNISQRVQIARHGFESVSQELASDFDTYKEVCARHGINISRRAIIEELKATERPAESGTTRWRRMLESGA